MFRPGYKHKAGTHGDINLEKVPSESRVAGCCYMFESLFEFCLIAHPRHSLGSLLVIPIKHRGSVCLLTVCLQTRRVVCALEHWLFVVSSLPLRTPESARRAHPFPRTACIPEHISAQRYCAPPIRIVRRFQGVRAKDSSRANGGDWALFNFSIHAKAHLI